MPVDLFRAWLIAANINFTENSDDAGIRFCIDNYVDVIAVVLFDTDGNLKGIDAVDV